MASFATYASSSPYSGLYAKYGVDKLHGLTPDDPSFMADTFYPSLAQFGFFGLLLFLYFWMYVVKRLWRNYTSSKLKNGVHRNFLTGLLIVVFFFIESIADSTFTHNRGAFILIILALAINNNSFTRNDKKRLYEDSIS